MYLMMTIDTWMWLDKKVWCTKWWQLIPGCDWIRKCDVLNDDNWYVNVIGQESVMYLMMTIDTWMWLDKKVDVLNDDNWYLNVIG